MAARNALSIICSNNGRKAGPREYGSYSDGAMFECHLVFSMFDFGWQFVRIGADGGGLAGSSDPTQHQDGPRLRVRHEQIAIRRGADDARHHECAGGGRVSLLLILGALHRSGRIAAGIEFDLESSRCDWPYAVRSFDENGPVVDRFVWIRLRRIGHVDLSSYTWLLLRIAGEGGLARDGLLCAERGRKDRAGDERGEYLEDYED